MSYNNTFKLIEEEKINQLVERIRSLEELMKSEKTNNRKKLSETWLDNQEVMDILKISPRTLQAMRDNKTLPFSKVGGKIYYRATDVEKLLKDNYQG